MKDKEFMVEKIRSQYTEQPHTELDHLKALDAKVKKPARVFAYTYGSIGTIVMGAGMSLIMTDIGAMLSINETLIPGIAVGMAGLIMMLTAYPIFPKRKIRWSDFASFMPSPRRKHRQCLLPSALSVH